MNIIIFIIIIIIIVYIFSQVSDLQYLVNNETGKLLFIDFSEAKKMTNNKNPNNNDIQNVENFLNELFLYIPINLQDIVKIKIKNYVNIYNKSNINNDTINNNNNINNNNSNNDKNNIIINNNRNNYNKVNNNNDNKYLSTPVLNILSQFSE
jgi:hypothetical protein